MDLDPSVVWDFAGTLVGTLRERPRQLPATVSRVDPDGTVWLSMPGADGLVPASTIADVGADDAVTVEWWGNAYHVTGNRTSPSVGTRAAAALRRATAAAAKVAGEAKGIADAVGQHFWSDDNGIHVSNEDGNATGERNILMNSLGILLRQGSAWLASFSDSAVAFYDGLGNEAANIVAQFGAAGAQIGYADAAHVNLGTNYFRMQDASGRPVINVNVANGPDGQVNTGVAFVAPSSTPPYTVMSLYPVTEVIGLYERTSSGYGPLIEVPELVQGSDNQFRISSTLTAGSTYVVLYKTDTTIFDASVGTRASEADGWTYPTGACSVVLGSECIASAIASFAAGEHVVSNFNAQAALGRYNAIDGNGDYALIIGNGTADDARSNAFAVGWDGSIDVAGTTVIRPDTGWVTLNAAIRYRIKNGICFVRGFSGSGGTAVNSGGVAVGTLPDGARPQYELTAAMSTRSSAVGQVNVSTSGVITGFNFGASSSYWGFLLSYPVD